MGGATAFPRSVGAFRRNAARHPRRQPAAEGRAARRPARERPLEGRVLAMIFDKPSTRTRVSFDVAMRQLGGETIMLSGTEMQLGRGETHRRHGARALPLRRRHHDPHPRPRCAAGARRARDGSGHQRADAALASLPDHGRRADLRGASRADRRAGRSPGRATSNNVLASWVHAAARFAFRLDVAAPPELAAAGGAAAVGRAERRRGVRFLDRSGGGGRRRRLRDHRHLGLDGRRRRPSAGTTS